MNQKKVIVAIIVLLAAVALPAADKRFAVSLTGNVLLPADSAFQDVYGKTVILPELQVGTRLKGPLYAFAALGLTSKTGTIPELGDEAKSDQQMGSLGVGVSLPLTGGLVFACQAGGCYFHVKEEALGMEFSASRLGFRADALLTTRLGGGLYSGVQLGYRSAKGENDVDPANKVSFTLGGFTAGVTLGLSF